MTSAGAPAHVDIVSTLDQRVAAVETHVYQEECWRYLTDPARRPEEVASLLKQVFLRVFLYQAHTTEAGFHMIGRLPKTEGRLLKTLLNHKAEEAEHNGWALRDHVKLGGSTSSAQGAILTPACFAVTGVWWRMAMTEDPFGYLGAEYLFEELTARVCARLLPVFEIQRIDREKVGFIVEHATEDVKHANLIRHWIRDVAQRYPTSEASMTRCFDYFNAVYPLPVWREAYEAHLAEMSATPVAASSRP